MASKNYLAADTIKNLVEGTTKNAAEKLNSVVQDDFQPIFYKIVVLEVFFDPTILDEKRLESISNLIVPNSDANLRNMPYNSILGQRVRDGKQIDERPELFFPFLPQNLQMPIKPGEHVWALYDDIGNVNRIGYYLWKISETRDVDDLNITSHDRKFVSTKKSTIEKAEGKSDKVPGFSSSDPAIMTLSGNEDSYKKLLLEPDASKASTYGPVPRKRKRPEDILIQSSVNSSIRMGEDLTGRLANTEDKEDGKRIKSKPDNDVKENSGTIDIVAGSKIAKKILNDAGFEEINKSIDAEDIEEGNPDFENDAARIYLSANTKADKNFKIEISKLKGKSSEPAPAAIIKVDQIRLIAREDIKIIVQPKGAKSEDCCSIVLKASGDITLTPSVKGILRLGSDDADLAILCNKGTNIDGQVSGTPIVGTMGDIQGLNNPTQGFFAKKVLIK